MPEGSRLSQGSELDAGWALSLFQRLEQRFASHRFGEEADSAGFQRLRRKLIACYAVLEGEHLWLRGLVGDPEGGTLLTAEARGPQRDATALGIQVAEELLDKGAGAILQKVYGEAGAQ
jgi:hypothetical protein